MASKEKETELQVSPSTAATIGKIIAALLGAMAAGGAGSVALAPAGSVEQEERIAKLESACSNYDIRLATAETKIDGVQLSLVDIKKDLADIRATSTQILLVLRRDR